jgi:hypothetical protein
MKFASRRLALLAGLALVVALPSVATANHSWNGYHWARTANPFTLNFGDNLSGTWDPYLAEARTDWNKSTVLDIAIVAGSAKAKNCRPPTGRVEACSASYGNTGWLGVAGIWVTGGTHITQGYVKVNDTYFNTPTYNTPAWRRLVMCQEVAHTFGLDHQDETFDNANLGSCMDYTNDPDGGAGGAVSNDPSNEHPNQHDYDELVTIYSHTDSFSTIGAATLNGAAGSTGSSAWNSEFGREVARTNGGHTSVFVRELGAGQRLITFVIWA